MGKDSEIACLILKEVDKIKNEISKNNRSIKKLQDVNKSLERKIPAMIVDFKKYRVCPECGSLSKPYTSRNHYTEEYYFRCINDKCGKLVEQ